jgi:DNA-binding FrmR family transcriptional regulator
MTTPSNASPIDSAATQAEAGSGREALARNDAHVAAHARTQEDLTLRLKSIEGHIRGIQRMVDQDAYCIDIMKQVKAVKQALERVSLITLETHLQTCVTDGLRSNQVEERERVIGEIVEVFNATGKL